MSKPIDQAAQQLEAYFVRSFLSEAKIGEGLAGAGFSGETFADMLQDALSESITSGEGLGVAKSLVAQLEPSATTQVGPTARLAVHGYQRQGGLSQLPVAGRVSSHFGHRADPINGGHRHHHGVDLAAPEGSPVRASGAGTVSFAGSKGSYGNLVIVDHGGSLQTRYAHLADVGVKEGQRLSAGDPLGTVGQTGRSTGPHLHFEIRRGGHAVNPAEELPDLNKTARRSNY